ncbi:TnsA endonuclease N-terminal domain-containing protein [Lederbergia sp. NSJ-179]|nr:TnsA endonuclease N-terminal domain-containing protein [Lederbergia sp. NSJ-179]
MAKRKRTSKVDKWIKEGRGTGSGANYQPWLKIQDVSLGIREQFPLLPQEETIVIAEELGIKHPADPRTGNPIVMTTDFLLTVDKGQGVYEVAHTIKMKEKLLEERVLEKFEIDREYWKRKGIGWGIVTEEEIDKTMARNISYIHEYFDIRNDDVYREMANQHIEDLSMSLMNRLLSNSRSIREIASEFDADTHLPF